MKKTSGELTFGWGETTVIRLLNLAEGLMKWNDFTM